MISLFKTTRFQSPKLEHEDSLLTFIWESEVLWSSIGLLTLKKRYYGTLDKSAETREQCCFTLQQLRRKGAVCCSKKNNINESVVSGSAGSLLNVMDWGALFGLYIYSFVLVLLLYFNECSSVSAFIKMSKKSEGGSAHFMCFGKWLEMIICLFHSKHFWNNSH